MAGVKGKCGLYKRKESTLKNMSLAKTGDKNINWKGGITKDKKKYFKDYWEKYKINNKEKVVANRSKMRAIRSSAEGSFSKNDWIAILKKYNYRCVVCGVHDNIKSMTPDHIIPLSKGGSNYPDNIQTMCLTCNQKKGNRRLY